MLFGEWTKALSSPLLTKASPVCHPSSEWQVSSSSWSGDACLSDTDDVDDISATRVLASATLVAAIPNIARLWACRAASIVSRSSSSSTSDIELVTEDTRDDFISWGLSRLLGLLRDVSHE